VAAFYSSVTSEVQRRLPALGIFLAMSECYCRALRSSIMGRKDTKAASISIPCRHGPMRSQSERDRYG
jgi:hypothetical protein